MTDLNKFKDWVAAEPQRCVRIDIEMRDGEMKNQAWAYDYKLMEGQHVVDADEIDLVAQKEKNDRKLYERLQKKYGGEG
jgi:hypothetical protein